MTTVHLYNADGSSTDVDDGELREVLEVTEVVPAHTVPQPHGPDIYVPIATVIRATVSPTASQAPSSTELAAQLSDLSVSLPITTVADAGVAIAALSSSSRSNLARLLTRDAGGVPDYRAAARSARKPPHVTAAVSTLSVATILATYTTAQRQPFLTRDEAVGDTRALRYQVQVYTTKWAAFDTSSTFDLEADAEAYKTGTVDPTLPIASRIIETT